MSDTQRPDSEEVERKKSCNGGFKKGHKPPIAVFVRMESGRLLPHQREIYGVCDGKARTEVRTTQFTDPDAVKQWHERMESYFQARVPDVWQAVYAHALRGNMSAARLLLERFDPEFGKDPEEKWKNQKSVEEMVARLKEALSRHIQKPATPSDPPQS